MAVEDSLSEAVLRKIIKSSINRYSIGHCYGKRGKDCLRKLLQSLNRNKTCCPFIVVVDLDNDECAPSLIKQWLPCGKQNNDLVLRIAVREIESWVLAHRKAFSKYFGVSINKIPCNTDSIIDPKEFLIGLTKTSKIKNVRESIVPKPNSTAKIGPDYNGVLIEFVSKCWKPNEAKLCSNSLLKAVENINRFIPRY